ncbi:MULTISPECIES: ABC transporter permease [unclassified Methylophaga]|mgnify:FL=1|jgi:peptide/nickel transport system permease protein|uniref:ABC transporter permease n=2 Tax=Methylophaga TaxID=40222 RepID=UPI000C94A35F|nr:MULTISPECIES: ABC transporter permease [unclassified Methylophaga]MAY16454.1 ABC transporter permease [Methylophaga sp.]MBN45046.1 ABC transporter permease [Methylophaga sp.]HCD05836.1 ABC transporter permease [Methylophaga sp.]|tara:strand:+ start:86291 stop:87487 length:1197 start_codon:yes stop_codon:yes gene_type:complete
MTEQVVEVPVKQPSKSWTQQVASSLLKRTSAKIGLAWIGLLVVIATFSPFLANSHPLYLVVDGQATSPLLKHMEALDWIWLSGFFITLVISAFSVVLWKKILLWLASMAMVSFIAYSTVSPPVLVVYEQYRELETAGKVENIIRVPIPYSAKDYLRDYADTGIESPLSAGERTHWMGTDENGADVASRMIHASRIALGIGFIATGIALVIGTIIGGLMGYFSGIVDIIGMRLVEIFEAIPTLFLLLSFVAFFGRSIYMMMVIIGITAWSGYARYVRAEFLKLRQQDFVQAAIASGLPLRSILFRHMLPNGLAPLLVATSFGVASAILAEATLSFLGLGLVDDPSWGQLLNQAVQSSTFNWWLAVFPGGAIFMTVFAYNLLGESLRDAVDPHTSRGMQS